MKFRKLGDRTSVPMPFDLKANPGRTKQSFQDEVDINNIMRRVRKGMNPALAPGQLTYGDFSNADDYKTQLDNVLAAQSDFDALPSEIRNRFNNEPAELLAFVEDEANIAEGRELGIFAPGETTPGIPVVEPPPSTDVEGETS